MTIVLVVFIICVVIVLGPLAIIWALNTLFALAIPFAFKTWLATFVLAGALSARAGKK